MYYSAHELDISEKYSDHILLFSRSAPPRLGTTAELFKRDTIEKAYEVPFFMLKKKEQLFRDNLMQIMKARKASGAGEQESGAPG